MFLQLTNTLTDKVFSFNTQTIFLRESREKVFNWVKDNLNEFNLCDESSCDVRLNNDTIEITGDEDRLILKITSFLNTAINL